MNGKIENHCVHLNGEAKSRRIFAEIEIAWAERENSLLSFFSILLFVGETQVSAMNGKVRAILWICSIDEGMNDGEQIPNCHFLPS